MNTPRIAVCFFGITRSLRYTVASIEQNVLEPTRKTGEVRVFGHFFLQSVISNPRSAEHGKLQVDEYKLLELDWLELEEPDQCLEKHNFDGLKKFGDHWGDDFRSLRNLIHQLHSIDRVTRAAQKWEPEIVVFVRPDIRYHDSIERYLKSQRRPTVLLPNWQHWRGGYNDRFSICFSESAAYAWGTRIDLAEDFCRTYHRPLHGELLLRHALRSHDVRVKMLRSKASRVRYDGSTVEEDFRHYAMEKIMSFPSGLKRRLSR